MELANCAYLQRSCRPLCPAFKANRTSAKAICSNAIAVPHLDGPTAQHLQSSPTPCTADKVLLEDELSTSGGESSLQDRENAATLVTLHGLTTRVHQGCGLLIQAGCYKQCLELLRASSFLILDEPLPDARLGRQLLSGLIDSSNTEIALTVLPLVAPSAHVYMAAIKAFAERGRVRGVREVAAFAQREGFLQGPASRDLWVCLVGAYGRLGRVEEARGAFKSMQQQGAWDPQDTHAANVLLHALHAEPLKQFIRWRQFEAAGVRPDTSTFNVLLKGCMRAKDAQRAELAHSWMQQAGVAGDEITFNTLIKAFSYAGQFEKVLGVRELMAREGFEATPRIWGSLLVACGGAGHLEQAHVLWGELKERHKQLVGGSAAAPSGVPPSSDLPYTDSRDSSAIWEGSMHLEDVWQWGGSPGTSHGSPAPVLTSSGFQNLESSEPQRSQQHDSQHSQHAQQQQDWASHLEGVQGEAERGQQPAQGQQAQHSGVGLLSTEVFNAMMLACIEGYQGERALHVFRELRDTPDVHPDHRSFNLVIKGCESPPARTLRPEQLATALALTAEMEAAGLQPDVFTYGTLIDLCARGKQGAMALELYQEMEARGVRANKTVVSSLFKALGAAGMVDDCMRIFRRIVWGPARLRPNQATFRHLLLALKESGALREALSVYQGMREMGYPPSRQEFSELVGVAAEHALRQQDSALQDKVLELANIKSCREVDLHGMSSTEARAAVLCVLSQVQQQHTAQAAAHPSLPQCSGSSNTAKREEEEMRVGAAKQVYFFPYTSLHDIVIITGAGRNSTAGEAVLPGVVLKLLREELGIAVQYNPQAATHKVGVSKDGVGGSNSGAGSSSGGSQGGIAAVDTVQSEQGSNGGAEGARQMLAGDAGGEEAAGRINTGRMVITKAALQQWIEGKKARQRGEARVEPGHLNATRLD